MYAYLQRSPGSCKSHLFVGWDLHCSASALKCLWGAASTFLQNLLTPGELLHLWATLSCQGTAADPGKAGRQNLPAGFILSGEQAPCSCSCSTGSLLLCPPCPRLHSQPCWELRELSQLLFLEYSLPRPHSSAFHSNVLLNRKIWMQALCVGEEDKLGMRDPYGKCPFRTAALQEELPEKATAAPVWCQGHYSKFLPKHPASVQTQKRKNLIRKAWWRSWPLGFCNIYCCYLGPHKAL